MFCSLLCGEFKFSLKTAIVWLHLKISRSEFGQLCFLYCQGKRLHWQVGWSGGFPVTPWHPWRYLEGWAQLGWLTRMSSVHMWPLQHGGLGSPASYVVTQGSLNAYSKRPGREMWGFLWLSLKSLRRSLLPHPVSQTDGKPSPGSRTRALDPPCVGG
jgi:hypothetical protein